MHKATRHSPHALAAASYRRHVEELETQRFERHATRGAADRAARARAAGAQRRRGVAPAPPSAGRARSVPPLPAVAVTPRWGSAAAVEEECPVCLSPLRHAVETPCRHRFCAPCLKQATLKSPNCPLCRSCLGRFAGAVDVVASPTSVIHGECFSDRFESAALDGDRRPQAQGTVEADTMRETMRQLHGLAHVQSETTFVLHNTVSRIRSQTSEIKGWLQLLREGPTLEEIRLANRMHRLGPPPLALPQS